MRISVGRSMLVLFWVGVLFTLVAPVVIGVALESESTAWVAALCGAFVTFAAKLDAIAELSLGPLKARMRNAIEEVHATVDQLRSIATASFKATSAELMAGNFLSGMGLKRRLELYEQLLRSLEDLELTAAQKQEATAFWRQGVGLVYHRAIEKAVRGNGEDPDATKAADEFQDTLDFPNWRVLAPAEMEALLNAKGVLTGEVQIWIDDYRHFIETGEIRRRELFVQA